MLVRVHSIAMDPRFVNSYNGLPVCAMRERVNRYNYNFRNILTAPAICAILKTAGNNFLLS